MIKVDIAELDNQIRLSFNSNNPKVDIDIMDQIGAALTSGEKILGSYNGNTMIIDIEKPEAERGKIQ